MLPIHIAMMMRPSSSPQVEYNVDYVVYNSGQTVFGQSFAPGSIVDVDVYDAVGADYELYSYPDAVIRTSTGDLVPYELGADYPETHFILTMPSYDITVYLVDMNNPIQP